MNFVWIIIIVLALLFALFGCHGEDELLVIRVTPSAGCEIEFSNLPWVNMYQVRTASGGVKCVIEYEPKGVAL
jgi:hypothetical protein